MTETIVCSEFIVLFYLDSFAAMFFFELIHYFNSVICEQYLERTALEFTMLRNHIQKDNLRCEFLMLRKLNVIKFVTN